MLTTVISPHRLALQRVHRGTSSTAFYSTKLWIQRGRDKLPDVLLSCWAAPLATGGIGDIYMHLLCEQIVKPGRGEGEKKRQVRSDCRRILTFASRCALVTSKKDLISAFHHVNDSSRLIAVTLCYSETRTKANVLLWIRPFFPGPPLALTHLLSINVCTMCRNNRPPAQLPVCLTHMNARTQALPDTHTQTRTSLLTQTWTDAHTHTHTKTTHTCRVCSSLLIHPLLHNAQMWCGAARVFFLPHLLRQGQDLNFIIFSWFWLFFHAEF